MTAAEYLVDEYPVELAGQPSDLSENYALTGGDEQAGISVFCSIGRWYAYRGIWRQLWFITLPNGDVIFSKHYGAGDDAQGPNTGLGGIEIIEPEKCLRLHYDGPSWLSTPDRLAIQGATQSPSIHAKLDIQFLSDQPIWDMHGGHSESAAIAGRMHYEQVGRLNGSIECNGQRFELTDGFANRDHSRGPRDVSRYHHHVWASATFDNGDSMQVYAMQSDACGTEGYDMSQASVIRDGKLYSVELKILTLLGDQPTKRQPDKIELSSELGVFKISLQKVLSQAPLSFAYPFDMMVGVPQQGQHAVCLDGLMQYECNGVKGLGWCEIGTATGSLSAGLLF